MKNKYYKTDQNNCGGVGGGDGDDDDDDDDDDIGRFKTIMLLLLSSINAVCCHQYWKIRAILYENRNMKEKPDESHWQGFKGRKCLQKDFKAVNEDVIITVVISI